jgi:Glycosyl transferase family 90
MNLASTCILKFALCCRVTLDLLSVQANTGPKWANKTEIAFWRGRDSRQERLDLVKLSRKHPDIIDARLTRMFFFKHSEDLGEMVEHISFFDFFKVSHKQPKILNYVPTVCLGWPSCRTNEFCVYYSNTLDIMRTNFRRIVYCKFLSSWLSSLSYKYSTVGQFS